MIKEITICENCGNEHPFCHCVKPRMQTYEYEKSLLFSKDNLKTLGRTVQSRRHLLHQFGWKKIEPTKLSTKSMNNKEFFKAIDPIKNETMQGLLEAVYFNSVSLDQRWMLLNYILNKETNK